MSGPAISIVISPGAAAQHLRQSVRSAAASGEACGRLFEIVLALADADAPTREVAEALKEPHLRLSPGSAATTRAAADLAWGEAVIPMRGGDLISRHYVGGLIGRLEGAGARAVIARPVGCVTYGGGAGVRTQISLGDSARGRAQMVFSAPFAPPLAAARAILAYLPARPWDLAADWAWTAGTIAEGLRHEVAEDAVYVARSPSVVTPLVLPLAGSTPTAALSRAAEPASEAEVAAVLYARSTLNRTESLRASEERLSVLTAEASAMQSRLAAALTEAQDARLTADYIRASTSWRLTAPLRGVVSLLRRRDGE